MWTQHPAARSCAATLALVLPCLCAAPGCAAPPGPPECPPHTLQATGAFHVERSCGRFLLVTPEGEPFYSTGVNHVSFQGDYAPTTMSNPYAEAVKAKYGTEERWAAATAARLQAWGWNTVGAWSSHESLGALLPYAVILNLSQANWQTGTVPDYFSDEWPRAVEAQAAQRMAPHVGRRNLLGYFIDNEVRWGPDWRALRELFDDYLLLPPTAKGRQALHRLLVERHGGDIARFNRAWGTSLGSFDELLTTQFLPRSDLSAEARADRAAFLSALAHRFFAVTTAAIRARDPHHLVLGVRFVSVLTPSEVVKASAGYLDVVSVNAYEYNVSPAEVLSPERFGFVDAGGEPFLAAFHQLTERPLLVTEFGFRARDSGLPNSFPPFYPTLADQRERADRFAAYAARCQAAPYVVGYHWFEYTDQPAAGRFDGEDNNWGLVDVKDDPYTVLVERTAAVNAAAGAGLRAPR